MTKTTAVATLHTKTQNSDGQTTLGFAADYNDPRNKVWSKYTPAFSVNMVVLDEVAEQFKHGETYVVTFESKRSKDF